MSIKLEWNYKKAINAVYSLVKKINITHIVLIILALHLFIMSTPSEGMVFDESHYVPAAKDTVNFVAANAEHTPLSKVVIGWSIQLFGDWWFGWRITPVIFSSLSILIVYMIACFYMDKKYALFAAAFASLDVLFFINGSIAILDPQALFFALAGVLFLLKKRYGLSAVLFGVAVLSKEIAVTVLLGIGVYLFLANLRGIRLHKPKFATFRPLLIFIAIFSLLVLGGIYAYDVAYKPASSIVLIQGVTANVVVDQNGSAITTSYSTSNSTSAVAITNPIQHLMFAFTYYTGLTPTINPDPKDFRPPWSWALPLVNAWNPPQYYGVMVTTGSVTKNIVSYYSQISYPVTVFLIPALVLGFYQYRKTKGSFILLLSGWLIGTYLPWLLFGAFVQKMTFNYYFLYTTPICDIAAVWFFANLKISNVWKLRFLMGLLAILGIYFLYYFPLSLFRA